MSSQWSHTSGPSTLVSGSEGEPTVLVDHGEAPETELRTDEAPDRADNPEVAPDRTGTATAASAPASSARVQGPGPLRWLRWYMSSSVGRRLMTMFVLAALVPVTLLAGLSYAYLAQVMQERLDQELTQDARLYAQSLSDRLSWAESLLDAASRSADPMERLAPRIGHELAGVALLDRGGNVLARAGDIDGVADVARLGLDADVEKRRSALFAGASSKPPVGLAQAVGGSSPIGFVAVTLASGFLWNGQAHGAMCALAGGGRVLSCTQPMPAQAAAQLATTPAGDTTVSLEVGGESARAAVLPLAVNDRFQGTDIVVATMQQQTSALHPAHWFRSTFLPVAVLTVLLVLILSIDQVRRILLPLRQLLGGMQRVARRDFDTPVPVNSRDEFGRMARSFNRMSAELGLRFRTLSAFSEIDRTILTTVDMRQVAEIALACIHEISGIKVVSLGLLEADSPGRTQVYLRAGGGHTVRDELPKSLDLSGVDSSLRKWSKSIKLPATYRSMLHERGAKYLYLLPIARADKVWGIVVLGHDQKTALSTDQALALAGVIDRLAVALSSVARDKQLHDQAHFDSLTGLPNRHYLMDMLTQQVKQARRDNQILTVLYIDLDRFKRTNDTLGHAAGDVLLRQAASRIRAAVRDVDIVARLGGDEFTVVLTQLKDAVDAGGVARTLIAALNEPFEIEGHVMYAGGSIGISVFPKDGQSAAELLKKADTALYLAKDRGRGRYAYFEERMNADASARVVIDRELREALKRGEFLLHYQPQIDLGTGEVCAVEALLRWQHPRRGLLAPEAFIDYAEESGLIEGIGTWVMREACQQHRRWMEAGIVIPRVSVNVSVVQLRNPSFAAAVEGALNSSTTPPNYLELEVTESLLVDAGPEAVASLERLRERGVEIAVDDFGTGYSSFAYVKQLPANILKLDRTFIADVVDNPQAAIITSAIIEMAHALGKTVVAEGVETPQQAHFLRRNFCARAQGFVFSAALPPQEIPAFVAERMRRPEARQQEDGAVLGMAHPQPVLSAA